MRKRIIDPKAPDRTRPGEPWLDLAALADVEVTSEDPAYPIESALLSDTEKGWRAHQPGPQTIRLLFHEPRTVKQIDLVFQEDRQQRTQEFVLRWSDADQCRREIVRQQFNFSPPDTATEHESYAVDLAGLSVLELVIDPDVGKGSAPASLARLRLA